MHYFVSQPISLYHLVKNITFKEIWSLLNVFISNDLCYENISLFQMSYSKKANVKQNMQRQQYIFMVHYIGKTWGL